MQATVMLEKCVEENLIQEMNERCQSRIFPPAGFLVMQPAAGSLVPSR
jgi:hypothetical protein